MRYKKNRRGGTVFGSILLDDIKPFLKNNNIEILAFPIGYWRRSTDVTYKKSSAVPHSKFRYVRFIFPNFSNVLCFSVGISSFSLKLCVINKFFIGGLVFKKTTICFLNLMEIAI